MKSNKRKTIKAYKGFNYEFKCNGFQFEVGKTYTHNGPIELCKSGFHACGKPKNVFKYKDAAPWTRFAEVELSGRVEGSLKNKYSASQIKIIREIPFDEFMVVVSKKFSFKDDNRAVSDSRAVFGSDAVSYSRAVSSSHAVFDSHAVSASLAISGSRAVSDSHAVSGSRAVSNSEAVSDSEAVFDSRAVFASHGIWRSFGVKNCSGVSNALFEVDKKSPCTIFGVIVPERIQNLMPPKVHA